MLPRCVLVFALAWLGCAAPLPPVDDDRSENATWGQDEPATEGPPPPTYAPCPVEADGWFETLVDKLAADMKAESVPGGAIAIVCGGRLSHARGVGVKHMNGDDPITEHTRFQWASTTKMFTGTVAAMLAQEGQLDLHAPMSALFDWYPQPFTTHQLLTHTAGFPAAFVAYPTDSLADVVMANADMPLDVPPGTTWDYSNAGYAVAGFLVQHFGGMPYRQLLEQRIFGPAGTGITMDVARVSAEDFTYGHSESYGPLEAIPPSEPLYGSDLYAPMGGAWGSVRDLARWAEIHLHEGDGVLPAEALRTARTPHESTGGATVDYGYGMFVDHGNGPVVVFHGGNVAGFVTDWTMVPDSGFGVFIVVNADWFWTDEISRLAVDTFAK